MTVPYTFGTSTSPIPLSNLDANFSAVSNSTNIAYVPPFTGGVSTTVQNKLAQTVSVKDFGAVGNGVTNDTTAFQTAINTIGAAGGGTIYIPAGSYILSTLNIASLNAISLVGTGLASTLIFNSATTDGIAISGTSGNIRITDVWIIGNATATAGSLINLTATANPALFLEDIVINKGFNAVSINSPGNDVFITSFVFNDQVNCGIVDYSGFSGDLGNINLSGNCGILKLAGLGPFLSNTDIFQCNIGVRVIPTTGITVAQMRFVNVTCENGTYGWLFGNGGGNIWSVYMEGCAGLGCSSSAVASLTGFINGLTIQGFLAGGNTLDGMVFFGVQNLIISESTIVGNGGNGIAFSGGVSNFSVMNNIIGTSSGYGVNVGKGVNINTGASNGYIISLNHFNGNTGGAIGDAGTGTNKFIGNNILV